MNILVELEPEFLADVLLAIHLSPVEISGTSKVEKNGDVYAVVGEPLILEQVCSEAETDFGRAYAGWTQNMMREGRGFEINKYRLWWHSHVFSRAFFSEIDNRTIESWSRTLDEWWLSMVLNKFGEFLIRLDIFKPRRLEPLTIRDVQLVKPMNKEAMRLLMLEREDRIKRAIEENVKITRSEKPFERILSGVFG